MWEPAAACVYMYENAWCMLPYLHADMSADKSGGSGRSDALWLFWRERSRRGVDTIDRSLTQGSPSTRVVSSSDTAGTSESISIDTHAIQLPPI